MNILSDVKILVTGSNGQIGTVLIDALRDRYGNENVVASDILFPEDQNGPFEILDITDSSRLQEVIQEHKITEIYHLAALLSSKGEKNIQLTWDINFNAYFQILNVAVANNIKKIFFPSTIGVFGHTTPKKDTPQFTSFIPETVYGISKYTGELWNNYFNKRYGLDIRSLRYPGVISYQSIPVGGTTDYAVEIFFEAVKHKKYECYLKADTALPMIYMPDAVKATLDLMSAPTEKVSSQSAYNLSGFSFTPAQLAKEIQKHIPDFQIFYSPDHRQQIAESWSESIDDSRARNDWSWSPNYDMAKMVEDMLANIS